MAGFTAPLLCDRVPVEHDHPGRRHGADAGRVTGRLVGQHGAGRGQAREGPSARVARPMVTSTRSSPSSTTSRPRSWLTQESTSKSSPARRSKNRGPSRRGRTCPRGSCSAGTTASSPPSSCGASSGAAGHHPRRDEQRSPARAGHPKELAERLEAYRTGSGAESPDRDTPREDLTVSPAGPAGHSGAFSSFTPEIGLSAGSAFGSALAGQRRGGFAHQLVLAVAIGQGDREVDQLPAVLFTLAR